MGNYYVDYTLGNDGNDGLSVGAPWKTIAKVNAKSFAAGDSCLFNKTATWNATLTPASSGSAGLPITFGAYGSGAKPIIDGTGLNACAYDNTSKGFITLDGLELANPNAYGVQHDHYVSSTETSTPNWTVQNCTFTHCGCLLFGPNTLVQDNIFVGPSLQDASIDDCVCIRGLVAVGCSVLRNIISGYQVRGIWFLNGADTPTANDNIVHDCHSGIDFDGYGRIITGTVTALRNTIYNCLGTDGTAIFLENCSGGSKIHGNLIHDISSTGYAIWYKNYAAGSHYSEQRGNNVGGVVDYNILYNCSYECILFQGVQGVDVWNNVLMGGASGVRYGIVVGGTDKAYCGDFDVRNNIFGDGGFTYPLYLPGPWATYLVAFDYNRVPTGTVIRETDTSTNRTLAQLQAGGACLNSFTTDPAFVDATNHDYHLTASSPCINAGVDVGLTTDYDGNPIH